MTGLPIPVGARTAYVAAGLNGAAGLSLLVLLRPGLPGPGGNAAILPQLGHMTNLEAPRLFNATILDFLGRAGATPAAIRSTAVNQ